MALFYLSEIKEGIRRGVWPPDSWKLPAPLPELKTTEEDPEKLDAKIEAMAREWAKQNNIKLH
ncbi:hypothetical protein F9B85_13335 [Heliorestis acidaminivorans]|uniref:Uncharacterized protein n=1 Tax=Heliorestis acidaminivorans TaxID=553427 RepID=A0A6I0EZ99_9FIRM|nr:hypothetical protein [Heliorestis acidaminivorans]KAB2951183.1 hypothetical protein F9B85_13335 [Heliorestis acidaminivorans]